MKMAPPKDLKEEINSQKYIPKTDMPELSEEAMKEVEKQKKELDQVKNWIVKKYKFALALGLLPPQSIPKIEEEDDIPEGQEKWVEINAEKCGDLPLIEEPMDPLDGAEDRKAELGF